LIKQCNHTPTDADCKNVFKLATRACQFLSSLSCKVLEHAAFKLVNPKNIKSIVDAPSTEITSYELAVQYNYSPDEKRCLLEVNNLLMIVCIYGKVVIGDFIIYGIRYPNTL
jgi:hypothetical protein